MKDPIRRILTKLHEARQRQPDSFGGKNHGYVLQPPLRETDVQAFERQHGITLPEEFRRFVLEAGSSGAGPYYGLLPMKDWQFDEEVLSRDCPLHPGMAETEAKDDGEGQSFDGTMRIVSQGCSYATLLVVTGRYRGRLVNVDDEDPLRPYFTKDGGFLSWYERWLDELLAGWDTGWFGFGMPGDGARMLEILTSPASTTDDRQEALRTVLRMPGLGGPLTAAVLGCLDAPEAKVRSLSAQLAGKHKLRDAIPQLVRMCNDDAAAVRRLSLRALHDCGARDWPGQAENALADPDYDVFFSALCLLSDARLITRETLAPLIASPIAGQRRSAIWSWGKAGFKVSNAAWLEARINDEDREVRRGVILAAADAGDRAFVPRLREMAKREGGEFDNLVANVRRRLTKWSLRWWAFWVIAVIAGGGLYERQWWAVFLWVGWAGNVVWRARLEFRKRRAAPAKAQR